MATSALLPAMESPPRKRKPATYGKQSRAYTRDFDDDFVITYESKPRSSSPSSHLTTPKKPTAIPQRSLDKSDSGLGEFDIPSSDEDTPQQLPRAVAPGRLAKAARFKAQGSQHIRALSRGNTFAIPDQSKRRKVDSETIAARPRSSTNLRSQPIRKQVTTVRRERSPFCNEPESEPQYPPTSTIAHMQESRRAVAERETEDNVRGRPRPAQMDATVKQHRKQEKAKPNQAKSSKALPRTYVSKRAGQDPTRLSTPPEDSTTSKSPRRTPRRKTLSTPPRQTPQKASPYAPSQLLSTPRHSPMEASPTPTPRAVMTPTQKRLWSTVLSGAETATETPSRSFKKLSIGSQSRPELIDGLDTPRKRRLIDLLKDAAQDEPSSDDLEIDDLASELTGVAHNTIEQEDVDMLDIDPTATDTDALPSNHKTEGKHTSNSQTQAPVHKFTYGGQRTFLRDENQSFEAMLAQPFDEGLSSPVVLASRNFPGPGQADSRKKDEFDISDDENGATGMRSVFELRAAAKSKTFSTNLDSIIDDLKDDSDAGRSRRQRALFELWKSLLNRQNRVLFTQNGSEFYVFEALRNAQDVITKATAAGILAGILSDPDSTIDVTHLCETSIVDLLTSILDDDRDLLAIARHRRSNMTKLSQASVAEMQSEMMKQDLWLTTKAQTLSPRLISLRGLESLVRKLRESGNVQATVLTNDTLTKLLAIVNDDALPCIRKDRTVPTALFKLETAMSILESCSISQTCIADRTIWTTSLLSKLVEAITASLGLNSTNGRQIKELALRVTVNLANEKENAHYFAQRSFLAEMLSIIIDGLKLADTGIEDPAQFDRLLLALGAMVNLAESSSFIHHPDLKLEAGSIDKLTLAFVANRKRAADADSLEKSQANVAYGYLAVILGHLCQEPALKIRIAAKLPGKRLAMVIQAVEEFILYHQVADKDQASNEAYASFTARLKPVVDTLQALDS